ncbi:O-antigen ligase [Magnetospirillum sp. SS-4]|uniref:O-antigen ligase family protein n=1 Tax=Magnetospirillum sp. SS-4 TaxID=2681465 RepID=UPI00137D751E|nr:O-antigen ligase family protein [Magnetospirillum sp. SS-4]CAA7614512.1 conserved membrane hypothetical protein [Magnetospirillum sp. SS-4]
MATASPSHPLALAAFAGPVIALYAPLGMAPLFIVVGLATLALAWKRRPWRGVDRRVALILGTMLAWAALSLTWALDPPQGMKTLAGLIGITGGGLLLTGTAATLDESERRRVGMALAAGVTLALLLVLAEIAGLGPKSLLRPDDRNVVDRLGRGLTVAAVLAAPSMVAAWRQGHRAWTAGMALLLVAATIGGHTLSAKLALLVCPPVFALALWRPRLAAWGVSGVAVTIALAFPLLSMAPTPQETMDCYSFLPNSAHHRLTIWTFTATRTMEKPLFGWGLDASRSLPGAEDIIKVWRRENLPAWLIPNGELVTEQLLPLHPHSGQGQIWLELGGVGITLLSGLLLGLGRMALRRSIRIDTAVLATMTISAFLISSVSYGIWQSWWLSSLWLAASLARASMPLPDGNHDGAQA